VATLVNAGGALPARNYAIDDIAGPNITGLGFATGFYTPGAPAPFGFSANDDLEVIDATVLVTQATPSGYTGLRYPFGTFVPNLGARWDAVFTNVLNGALASIPYFIFRVDEVCTAAATPYAGCTGTVGEVNTVSAQYSGGAAALPTAVTSDVTDVGSNPSSGAIGPTPMLATQFSPSTGIAEPWVAADLITWVGSLPAATTGRGVHMASTSIVVPFFDLVQLWRVNLASELVYCGINFPAPALTDNGVNRFWTYTVTLPTAAGAPCTGAAFGAGATWAAVGLKGGAALVSTLF
jgi:hypothetical protein